MSSLLSCWSSVFSLKSAALDGSQPIPASTTLLPGASRYATSVAPHCFDLVKYWGDASSQNRLPLHGIVALVSSCDHLCTFSEARATLLEESAQSPAGGNDMDTITIDSVTCRGQHMPRGYASVLATLRSLAKGNLASTTVSVVIRTPARNGLASVTDAGAAAAAAFVVTVAAVLAADEAYDGQFAQLARKIGGLACTSLVGGFVKWSASTVATKEDDEIEPAGDNDMAMARRTAPEETSVAACICEPHAGLANDVRTITVVVSPEASQLRALAGSQTNAADEGRIAQASLDRFATAAARSVTTSPLLTHRVEKVVPARLHAVESCVARGDFEGLARLACAESNQVAAICSDTAPPLYFMSDVTRRVVAIVERYNHHVGRTAAAYTSAPLSASVTVIVKGAADEAAMLARLLHAFPAMPSSGRTLLAPRLESAKAEADADVMSLPFVRGLGVTEKLSALGIKALGDLASLTPPPESPNAVVWPDSVYGIVVGGVGAGAHAEDIGASDVSEPTLKEG